MPGREFQLFASLSAEQNEQALQTLRDFMVMILCEEPELYVHFYRNPPSVTVYVAIMCRELWAGKFPADDELTIEPEEMEKLILGVKSMTEEEHRKKFKVVNRIRENFIAGQRAKKSALKLRRIRIA